MEGSWLFLENYPALSVAVFSLAFRAIGRLLHDVVPLPSALERDQLRSWKWRNLCVSLAHSLLTGPWAATCVSLWPNMLKDICSSSTPGSYLLICVSSGYFIQDTGDIIFSGHAKGSWEFLLHHFLVLWCFLYVLYRQQYVGGAVVALLVEVNSVTLHTRLLLKLAGARTSALYRANRLLNLFTYVTFRLGTQLYITYYLLSNYSWLDHSGYFLITVLLMDAMILVYFYRLLKADFLPGRKAVLERNTAHNYGFSDLLKD